MVYQHSSSRLLTLRTALYCLKSNKLKKIVHLNVNNSRCYGILFFTIRIIYNFIIYNKVRLHGPVNPFYLIRINIIPIYYCMYTLFNTD